jgi:small nuclear ribonucleoprotein (snRNP)-like protein
VSQVIGDVHRAFRNSAEGEARGRKQEKDQYQEGTNPHYNMISARIHKGVDGNGWGRGKGNIHHILRTTSPAMATSIVLPIKKVFSLVDSRIIVEIKDEERKFQGRLMAVDEYLNIHLEETVELVGNERGRNLGTVVIRGNNILTISPVI